MRQADQYTYRLPYALNENKLGSAWHSRLTVTATSDQTTVRIDTNADGSFETTTTLNAGESVSASEPTAGASVVTDNPATVSYSYGSANFGSYEDGRLQYGLLSEQQAGADYYSPVAADALHVVASDDTELRVDANADGQFESTRSLTAGESTTISDISSGAHLSADAPIHVTATRANWEKQGYTYAATLLPTSHLQTEYTIPKQPDYNAKNPTDKTGVYVVATEDDTTVSLDTGDDGTENTAKLDAGETTKFPVRKIATLSADAPIAATYTYHVRAEDWWNSGTYRNFIGAVTPVNATNIKQGVWNDKHWDGGIKAWSTYDFTPNEPPNPQFTISPETPTAGDPVTFSATESSDSDGSIQSYAWDFDGDGTTDATGATVEHTYDQSGVFAVSVTVTDDDGATATEQTQLTVEAPATTTTTTTTTTATSTTVTTTPTTTTATTTTTTSTGCQPAKEDGFLETMRLETGDGTIDPEDPGTIEGVVTAADDNQCPVRVELTLVLANGMQVNGGQTIETGPNGSAVSEFVVAPGETETLFIGVFGATADSGVVQTLATSHPVDNPSMETQHNPGALEFDLQPRQTTSSTTTATTTQTPTTTTSTTTSTTTTTGQSTTQTSTQESTTSTASPLTPDPEPTEGDSETEIPGFGVSTALVSVALAVALLLRTAE